MRIFIRILILFALAAGLAVLEATGLAAGLAAAAGVMFCAVGFLAMAARLGAGCQCRSGWGAMLSSGPECAPPRSAFFHSNQVLGSAGKAGAMTAADLAKEVVTRIDKMAASVDGMNTLMMQTQSLQGAALIGKDVLVAGNNAGAAATAAAQVAGVSKVLHADGAAFRLRLQGADGSAAVLPNRPVLQLLHTPDPLTLNLPSGHTDAVPFVDPNTHAYPALQLPLQPGVDRPLTAPNVPAGHGPLHAADGSAVVLPNRPALQLLHTVRTRRWASTRCRLSATM